MEKYDAPRGTVYVEHDNFMGENCCFFVESGSRSVCVIDPGMPSPTLSEMLGEIGTVEYVLLTHGHYDHIGAVDEVKRKFPDAKLCIHSLDENRLTDAELSLWAGGGKVEAKPDIILAGGESLPFGKTSIEVIHTPGHSPGSVVFYLGGALFTGDTLFNCSIGRTDLPGGDRRAMAQSLAVLAERMSAMPDETLIFPGHGAVTTVGRETRLNPYLRSL